MTPGLMMSLVTGTGHWGVSQCARAQIAHLEEPGDLVDSTVSNKAGIAFPIQILPLPLAKAVAGVSHFGRAWTDT